MVNPGNNMSHQRSAFMVRMLPSLSTHTHTQCARRATDLINNITSGLISPSVACAQAGEGDFFFFLTCKQ